MSLTVLKKGLTKHDNITTDCRTVSHTFENMMKIVPKKKQEVEAELNEVKQPEQQQQQHQEERHHEKSQKKRASI